MSEASRQSMFQTIVMTYFPMFIAALSLCTSIYNGYLNNKFVDLIQNNTARVESLRTCKETIDAYFQIKFRAGVLSRNAERAGSSSGENDSRMSPEMVEAVNAVSKFAALGTYLANLRDDSTREQYTALSVELEKIVAQAARTQPAEIEKLFANADRMFTVMNNDCVKSARTAM
jgi:hypothetical protein